MCCRLVSKIAMSYVLEQVAKRVQVQNEAWGLFVNTQTHIHPSNEIVRFFVRNGVPVPYLLAISGFYSRAWSAKPFKTCVLQNPFRCYFERTGCLLTTDGSEDQLVRPEALGDLYSWPATKRRLQMNKELVECFHHAHDNRRW